MGVETLPPLKQEVRRRKCTSASRIIDLGIGR